MKKVVTYFLLGVLFAAPGGYGLYRLIIETKPYLKERWLFFVCLFFLICGIMLPFFALLNRYFFTRKRIEPQTVVREACGVAVLCSVLLWFRMGRVLSTPIIFILVGGAVVLEIFLRARETVSFRTGLDEEDDE